MLLSEDQPLALVVDDDEVFRTRLCRALVQRNWEAEAVGDGEGALQFARDRSPDLVLVDLRMPGKGGLEIIQELRTIDSSMTIIVLTGYGSIPTAISAMKRGADHYLSKPADADQILAVYDTVRNSPATASEIPETVPTLDRVEWEHIQRIIFDCDGNISRAARLLGIHRRSLQRKLAKHPPPR
ncbi:MAG: response regulator [Bryobacteraceae bacterium]|jgi:two-component system response regulator RegA